MTYFMNKCIDTGVLEREKKQTNFPSTKEQDFEVSYLLYFWKGLRIL